MMSNPEAEYTQINEGGVIYPEPASFPPVTERVSQNADPFKPTLRDYDVQRTTLQWTDNCNLRCNGCYAKPYLPHGKELNIVQNERRRASAADTAGHIAAHGAGLSDVYFLGLEPTLQPAETASMMRAVHESGRTTVAVTNGATGLNKFTETFSEAIESGQLKRLNISLDSMDAAAHNTLRGRSYAFERTIEAIQYAVEKQWPLQINMTVWRDNYHSVIDSVRQLYAMGVRGFAFHEGSLEGAPDYQAARVRKLDPLAWRALTSQLEILKKDYAEDETMQHFIFPYNYYTEAELREGVIGDEGLTRRYLAHVALVEAGEASDLPFVACPAVDVPQTYVFGNDGPGSNGAVSLCNMHTMQTGTYLSVYDPQTGEFKTVQDAGSNQIAVMQQSPNLCPARPAVMRDGTPSDRYETETGDLFHACRYISSNQFPFAEKTYAQDRYEVIRSYHELRSERLRAGVAMTDIDAIETGMHTYDERLAALQTLS